MLFLRLIKMITAPLVFATLVGASPIWAAALGSTASSPRPWLVPERLVRLVPSRPRHSQPAAARRQLPGRAARRRSVERPAGLGLLAGKIPDPSHSDLGRQGDGAERDPADRGFRRVLRRGDGRHARAIGPKIRSRTPPPPTPNLEPRKKGMSRFLLKIAQQALSVAEPMRPVRAVQGWS